MREIMLQGLSITGFGMGLVFLMIIALWGIMALLVRLTNRPAEVVESEEAETHEIPAAHPDAVQAAAAAVAYALAAEQIQQKSSAQAKATPLQSQWLLSGRVRQTLHHPGKGMNK
jgi:Na+-transporting methylmalonyl-CoA/oxaloacetate decarboxylase gamma subunit